MPYHKGGGTTKPRGGKRSGPGGGRKGHQENGSSKKLIDSALLDYYRNINEQLNEGFTDDAHKELFLSNVFEQLVKDGVKVSKHQSTSFTVEKLVRLANAEQLKQLLQTYCNNFNDCISDRSTSYVLQTTLYRSAEFLRGGPDDPFVGLLHQFGMQLLERSDLITSSHASHVIRTLVEVMAGVKVEPSIVKGKHARQDKDDGTTFKPHELYGEYEDLLTALANRVLPVSADSMSLVENPHTAALAEIFLLVFKEKSPARCQSLCRVILKSGNLQTLNSDGVPELCAGQTTSYFVSALVRVMSDKQLGKMLDRVVLPYLTPLINHPQANYVVQEVIDRVPSESRLNTILDRLEGQLSQLIANQKGGIVLKLSAACLRVTECQERFEQMLLADLAGSASCENVFLSLACPSSAAGSEDELAKSLQRMDYFRSVLLQRLFGFEQSRRLCDGLSRLSGKCLLALASSKFGSFVIDAFLKSPTVPPASKKTFAEANQEVYPMMAKDSYGSRVFESIWAVMSVPVQKQVAGLLGQHHNSLTYSKFGKIVSSKLRLSDYLHRRAVWDKWLTEENKQRKLATIVAAKSSKKAKKQAKGETTPASGEKGDEHENGAAEERAGSGGEARAKEQEGEKATGKKRKSSKVDKQPSKKSKLTEPADGGLQVKDIPLQSDAPSEVYPAPSPTSRVKVESSKSGAKVKKRKLQQ